MNRSPAVPQRRAFAIRTRLEEVTGQSERTILLGSVLLLTALSAAMGYVLAQFFGVDVSTSLLHPPEDCFGRWGTNIGRHCFSDYAMVVGAATRDNPWQPYPMLEPHPTLRLGYPAAGILPQLLFGVPAKWLGVPLLGLFGYELALSIAVFSPAIWAARGTQGLERVVVFVALGAAAIPAWATIDRGNSVGFVVPIALTFLVALRRQRWGCVTVMIILASMVKPQFAVLVIALFTARQWRMGGFGVAGIAIANFAAYLLWPRHFPATITQSIHNLFGTSGLYLTDLRNVSFGRAILLAPDYFKLLQTGQLPDSFLAGPRALIGYGILAVIVACMLGLGRRIAPVMSGIVLLATATLFPPLALFYYLVFVLPVAALIVRDPNGPPGTGIFDNPEALGGRRRTAGIWVSLATALAIAQIALPGPIMNIAIPGQTVTRGVVGTTVFITPFLWLVACAIIIVSYARRPASVLGHDQEPAMPDVDSWAGSGSPGSSGR